MIEGDHGSAYFHPDSAAARDAIGCQIELQARAGGDAQIGRRLYPLLTGAGFAEVGVSPRMVYVDASRPALVEGFTRRTFTAMIEGVREPAIAAGLLSRRGSTRACATSTARPRRTACSVTRSSKAPARAHRVRAMTNHAPDTIVLIHGFWVTPRSWEHWIDALRSARATASSRRPTPGSRSRSRRSTPTRRRSRR